MELINYLACAQQIAMIALWVYNRIGHSNPPQIREWPDSKYSPQKNQKPKMQHSSLTAASEPRSYNVAN